MTLRYSTFPLLLLCGTALAADPVCPPGAVPKDGQVSGGPATWCELEADRSLLHGPYQAWHPNGNPGFAENYIHGKAAGKATYWWASGNRQAEGFYRNGLRDGWWTFWDKNGVKEGRVRFLDGRPVDGQLPKWALDWDGSPTASHSAARP